MKAGQKTNVVPGKAMAVVNHRIHPGDKNADNVLQYDKHVISDQRVKLSTFDFSDRKDSHIPPAPVSSIKNETWKKIRKSVADVYGAPVAPFIMVGNTDTRWYWDLSDDIYRFNPIVIDKKDTDMFHGYNERISTCNLLQAKRFYTNFIKSCVL